MLDHVSITVTDIAVAEPFYDAVMRALDVPKVGSSADWVGYGLRADGEHPDRAYLSLRRGTPDGHAAGRHWCFKARDRRAVDAFWTDGIAAGGRDDGAPGLRSRYHPSYYAAFLLDPDGNRIEAVCHRATERASR